MEQSPQPFFINSFLQIGLEDPFPDDENLYDGSLDDESPDTYKMPSKVEHPVYAESRYINGFGPYCLYIPRRELMFKLMRACIDVKSEDELWFN